MNSTWLRAGLAISATLAVSIAGPTTAQAQAPAAFQFALANFGVNQGWQVNAHPRFLADITGDGRADVVGMGNAGVYTAVALGNGGFGPAQFVLSGFGVNQGWQVSAHPRFLADITGDGRADVVGMGNAGVWTAIALGNGGFGPAQFVLSGFGVNQGWQVNAHPRFLADITGDRRADIVGMGNAGVWTAVALGNGGFGPAQFVLSGFGVNQSWQVSAHPRFLADITGDGRADIVGMGNAGVWTAIALGNGGFGPAQFVLSGFGVNQGWQVTAHPRFLADITGDRRADIVGMGNAGVWTAVALGNGGFAPAQFVLSGFGVNHGWQVNAHPRFLADITGDRRADIVGMGNAGVYTAVALGNGGFGPAQFVLSNFGVNQGWQVNAHPRFLADITGDRRDDIVGMGNAGVYTATAQGNGHF
ncbi:VCBS repeat-containing protein [Actinophytocola sp.]|uniref:FG-GAP repeat domain-containing protein n=1 Tax=Actinophytocola sp. TaxID=1872138 RepID=UPI002ED601FF